MKKKAFVFDLDGTLLNSDKKIFKENIDAINKLIDNGYFVGIITGRNFSQIQDYLEPLKKIKYFVVLNGGALYNNETKELKYLSKPLDKNLVQFMLNKVISIKRELQFSNYDRLYRVYFGNNIFEDIKEPGFFKDATKNPKFDDWNDIKDLLNKDVLRIAIRCEKVYRQEIIKELIQQGFDKLCDLSESSNTYVECDPIGISKFNTLKTILDEYNIDLSNVYAFGDSENDLSVLEKVGHSVCMGNANDNIKNKCKYVIDNNNTLAIAEFLKQFS